METLVLLVEIFKKLVVVAAVPVVDIQDLVMEIKMVEQVEHSQDLRV